MVDINKRKLNIRPINKAEQPPLELLLLADPSESAINDYIHRGYCFIAKNESEVIGVYVLLPTRPHTMELVNVAVREDYHGQGYGKRLVLDAIKRAKEMGIKTLELGTGNSSIQQLALYQKCGFRILGIDKDYFIKHYDEPIFENGIQCVDMIRLSLSL